MPSDDLITRIGTVEFGLLSAYRADGLMPQEAYDVVHDLFRSGELDQDTAELTAAARASGNPVVPFVERMRARVAEADAEAARWVHLGATSQDVLDTALMLLARDELEEAVAALGDAATTLVALAVRHRDDPAAARTLDQHAVPTTIGARTAIWLRAIVRARRRLADTAAELPVQLGGAAGTQASFVQLFGAGAAARLPAALAEAVQLVPPPAPWHTDRYPILDLAHAAGAAIAAMGKTASDVVTLARTEIAEASAGAGGSSAMPQKRNPVDAVLLRSAAMRAPALVAQLHTAAGLAGDERPDGAWHAEWEPLQELLRLLVASAAQLRDLVAVIEFDVTRARANLGLTHGLIVSERLALVLRPRIGAARFAELIRRAASGEQLAALVHALPEASGLDVDELLDPARYTGRAGELVDDAVRYARQEGIR